MLQNNSPTTPHGFLIGVDIQDGVDVEAIRLKLADALFYVEGVGKADVEHLGKLDVYEDGKDIAIE